MVASLAAFNPLPTTNAFGYFSTTTEGYIAGTFRDDPAIRNQLAGGVLAQTETLPMWGGVGVFELIPNATVPGGDVMGPALGRALTQTAQATGQLTGFSVFNQAHNWVNVPNSKVPLAASGMSVPFFRLGSRARITVACATSLVSLDGGLITQLVSWDFNAQQLIPYVAAYAANVITATAWASTNGGQATFTTTTAHGVSVGSYFTVAGSTPAGYNGDYVALTGTTGSTLIGALVTNPGAITTEGTLVAGGGALPVQVLKINPNGLLVGYSASQNTANFVAGVTAEIKL